MATAMSELARPLSTDKYVSFEQYIEWLDEDTRAEWVNGRIEIMASPAAINHQNIAIFLDRVLGIYIESHDLGQLIFAPYVMRMAAIARGREPDLIFVRKDRAHLITRHYLDGPADLAIEIVSPESRKRDRKVKFAEYQIAGISEYWLIDPDKQTADFYQLDEDGSYEAAALDEEGFYHSRAVAGFRLRTDWLWQSPLPATLDVLRELKVL
ncbi:MAG TPA: Uma2 family endonuclease [Blastocatellia bacterium]|nr:Uma2 family endonuclease [Blastocatellia bacterium]HMV86429.1 Uma2 family endonuclease [Blastocatellia bacterium]HMX27043.1 Uma2 family endonuclease [Blastocatellia bacterium]HMY73347.1 Uma2 family endonuclease [Blastocatellia bacterium]HMZ20061.1 Uma2 family endonuclease [Blastocatellia bacterium]